MWIKEIHHRCSQALSQSRINSSQCLFSLIHDTGFILSAGTVKWITLACQASETNCVVARREARKGIDGLYMMSSNCCMKAPTEEAQ